MKKLEGKTAFVTGAAGGIGLGLAKTFARAGMNIVIADIQDKQLKVAESELQEITDNVLALVVDTTDTGSIENAAEKV